MDEWHCLKLNPEKTEFILFGSNVQPRKCITTSLNACGSRVSKTDVVRYLGTWFDKTLNFNHHIQQKCKLAMWNLKRIWSIMNVLERESCMILICSIVLFHLDYCNCCLFGICEYLLIKMKCCMGCANEEQNIQFKCSTAWTPLVPNQALHGI